MPNDGDIKSRKVEYLGYVRISKNFLEIGGVVIRAIELDEMRVAVSVG